MAELRLLALLLVLKTFLLTVSSQDYKIEVEPFDRNADDIFIWFNAQKENSVRIAVNNINKFLNEYKNQSESTIRNCKDCDCETRLEQEQFCNVNLQTFGPCRLENNYGYRRRTPCIFFKLKKNNKNWTVSKYDIDSLPAKMPRELKERIKINERKCLDAVWFSCYGANPVDEENIGPIQYLPERHIPSQFFQNDGVNGYVSPLRAIFLERPAVGIVIEIECKFWAKSMKNEYQTKRFEILVD